MLIYIAAFIVAISVLVVVHEWGHFAVARFFDVKVLRFSIGFGKVLWSRNFGPDKTELAICALPLGGYVKMLDEREAPVAEHELARAFNRQTLGRRTLVVLAGPVANLILAFLLYWGVFMHGVEELRPMLGTPPAQTLAESAGLKDGDTVTAVNGEGVDSWDTLHWMVLKAVIDGKDAQLLVRAIDGGESSIVLRSGGLDLDSLGSDPMRYLGLRLAPPRFPAVIDKVVPDMPGAAAGLQPGDEITAIDGKPVRFWSDVSRTVSASPDKLLRFDIRRAGAPISVEVTPRLVEEKGQRLGRVGFSVRDAPEARQAMYVTLHYPFSVATGKALEEVWERSILTLRMIGRMLVGQLSVKNLSGPVTIAEVAGVTAQLGLEEFIKFLAAFSVGIGVLNLLPIPVLDGGHLMYYLAEFFRGKPLSERVLEAGQKVGLTLLLLMMGIALFNDLNRQFLRLSQ